jgi:hypothetical protein
VVSGLLLITIVPTERSFEQVAVVNIFRYLGLLHIAAAAILYCIWPRFAQFMFRVLAWPMFMLSRKVSLDSPHYADTARATVFLSNEVPWRDVATVCGAFTVPTSFLVITKRTRLLERILLRNICGDMAPDQNKAAIAIEKAVRAGSNMIVLCDDLSEDGSPLAKSLLQLSASRRVPLVPCLITRPTTGTKKLVVKFGIPFGSGKAATTKKLAKELTFLRTTAANGGGSVG